jgi:hypothetical protein
MDKKQQPILDKICVLYNREGRIVHTHREVTMPGGRTVTDDEVEAHGKELATAAGHDIRALSALRVAAEDYDESSAYRVDVEKKELVKQHPPTVPVVG